MGKKRAPTGWEEQLRSPKEFNRLLEELHNQQEPGVFSAIGMAFGWCPQPIPPGIMRKVMTAITEDGRVRLVSRRIFKLTGLLDTFLFLLALNFLTRFGAVGELSANLQMEVGLFLLVASLGMGLSALMVSLFVGECLLEKRLG